MTSSTPWVKLFGVSVSLAVMACMAVVLFSSRQPPLEPAAAQDYPAHNSPVSQEPPAFTAEAPEPLPLPDRRGVEESATPLTNATPLELMGGTLEARARGDRAWLARTLASLAGKAVITEVDLHSANRQFLGRSIQGMWRAVEAAWQSRDYSLGQGDETVELRFRTGGNLQEFTIKMVRIGDAWYFAGT